MRLIMLIAALSLGGCTTVAQPPPADVQDQRSIGMLSLVDSSVVHAFRADSNFSNFDNQYPLTWNVSDMLVDATSEAASVEITLLTAPQWLAKARQPVTRSASGGYLLDRTTAVQLSRYCVAQNLVSLIIWLDDNQTRTVQGAQYELVGNGAIEIDSPGVNPFIAYSSALGIGVLCDGGRISAVARDNKMLRIANFRPPPGGLPQLELDKTRPYFEQISQQLARDLLNQMGL